jgi:protein involved in polysaccharide export with SLBB domain
MKQLIRIYLFCIVGGLLLTQAGCQSDTAAPGATIVPASPTTLAGEDYVLVPGDTISLKVTDHQDLDRDNIKIPDTYIVSFPYFDKFNLKGMTRQQVEDAVKAHYAETILVHPYVFVDITAYKERFVYVQGEVKSTAPITFPIEKGMTLDVAISKAGGLTEVGDATRVELIRKQPDGTTKTTVYNLKAMRSGGKDIPLEPDDIINVKKIWI